MDVARPRPYVGVVNLLLLLSALLSALTGVSTGTRAPQATVAVAQAAAVEAAGRATKVVIAGRQVAPRARLRDVVQVGQAVAFRLAPAEPLYQSRRRE